MKKLSLSFLFVAAALIFTAHAKAQAVVIANNSVKAAAVSKSELRDVFNGASSSLKDGSHVVPVLQKQGAAHEAFLSEFIGKSDSAFRANWRSLVFSGQAAMPRSVDSDAAMVEYVSHSPGAIGYIGKSASHEGVKVLAVK